MKANQVPSPQSNFPVLISDTYPYLKATDSQALVHNSNGYDIGFYGNSDCVSNKLAWETELYKANTGEVRYWVKIPTLSSSTTFYMCYGNSSISTDQSNKAQSGTIPITKQFGISETGALSTLQIPPATWETPARAMRPQRQPAKSAALLP
jgi:hypothetical protein